MKLYKYVIDMDGVSLRLKQLTLPSFIVTSNNEGDMLNSDLVLIFFCHTSNLPIIRQIAAAG